MPSVLCYPIQHPLFKEMGGPLRISACPTFPFCPPFFCPSPYAKICFLGIPAPLQHPSYMFLLHFKLWVVPCSSLLWGGTMCPVPARPEALTIQPPSLSPHPVCP